MSPATRAATVIAADRREGHTPTVTPAATVRAVLAEVIVPHLLRRHGRLRLAGRDQASPVWRHGRAMGRKFLSASAERTMRKAAGGRE